MIYFAFHLISDEGLNCSVPLLDSLEFWRKESKSFISYQMSKRGDGKHKTLQLLKMTNWLKICCPRSMDSTYCFVNNHQWGLEKRSSLSADTTSKLATQEVMNVNLH